MAKELTAAQKKAKAAKDKARRDKAKKTASASKGTKPVKQPIVPEPQEDTRKLPGKRAIQNLSKEFMAASDRASTLAGKAGELISNAVTKIHLNAREFKRAQSFKSMGLRDPGKLRTALSDFDYYRECLELDKLAGDGLFDAGEGRPVMEADDDETETGEDPTTENASDEASEPADPSGDNIHHIGRGRSDAA